MKKSNRKNTVETTPAIEETIKNANERLNNPKLTKEELAMCIEMAYNSLSNSQKNAKSDAVKRRCVTAKYDIKARGEKLIKEKEAADTRALAVRNELQNTIQNLRNIHNDAVAAIPTEDDFIAANAERVRILVTDSVAKVIVNITGINEVVGIIALDANNNIVYTTENIAGWATMYSKDFANTYDCVIPKNVWGKKVWCCSNLAMPVFVSDKFNEDVRNNNYHYVYTNHIVGSVRMMMLNNETVYTDVNDETKIIGASSMKAVRNHKKLFDAKPDVTIGIPTIIPFEQDTTIRVYECKDLLSYENWKPFVNAKMLATSIDEEITRLETKLEKEEL